MAKTSARTLSKINRFIREVEKEFAVKKVILFGSHATGKAGQWSDIDLAIVSNDFKNIDLFQRLVILGKIAWPAKTTDIEALGFTPGEFEEASELDFAFEIKNKGIALK